MDSDTSPEVPQGLQSHVRKSLLYSLPLELRVMIYKLVVIEHEGKPIDLWKVSPAFRNSPGTDLAMIAERASRPHYTLLDLAFTCRQMYEEVAPLYYRHNIFMMTEDVFLDFAHGIGPTKSNLIRDIYLRKKNSISTFVKEAGGGRWVLEDIADVGTKLINAALELFSNLEVLRVRLIIHRQIGCSCINAIRDRVCTDLMSTNAHSDSERLALLYGRGKLCVSWEELKDRSLVMPDTSRATDEYCGFWLAHKHPRTV